MKTGATRDPHWHSRLANVLQFFQRNHRPHSTIGNNPARRQFRRRSRRPLLALDHFGDDLWPRSRAEWIVRDCKLTRLVSRREFVIHPASNRGKRMDNL